MNIQIETTNRCNLVCKECPNRFMKRKRQDMTVETFDVILENYIKTMDGENPTVILHKDGEPLMNDNLRYFIRRIADVRPDVKIDIYTNGLLLTEEFVQFLSTIPNKVWLLVSFHFLQVMEKEINISFKNNIVLENCVKKNYENIEYVFVTHEVDGGDSEKLKQWQKDWTDKIAPFPHRLREVVINPHINPWTGLIQDSHNVQFETCPYGDFGHLFIGVTGTVLPCCMDLEEELDQGNIMTTSKQLLFDRMSSFYDLINNGNIEGLLCKKCLK